MDAWHRGKVSESPAVPVWVFRPAFFFSEPSCRLSNGGVSAHELVGANVFFRRTDIKEKLRREYLVLRGGLHIRDACLHSLVCCRQTLYSQNSHPVLVGSGIRTCKHASQRQPLSCQIWICLSKHSYQSVLLLQQLRIVWHILPS